MIGRRLGLRRPTVWFAMAAVLAVLAVVVVMRSSSASGPGARVVVARVIIPAGTMLDEDVASQVLALAPVPDGLALRGLITGADGAVGHRTVAALGPGEPLTQAVIGGSPGTGPAPLEAGQRAVPVPMRAVGGAAPVPGSRVDVIASDGEGPAGRTRVIVSDAEVMSVTPPGDGETADAGGVVLRLATDDALQVARALDFAREVRVIARPAGEG